MPRPMTQAGKLTKRGTIKSPPNPEGNTDSYGQPSDLDTTIGEYWMQIEPLSGDELEAARQVIATGTHRVTMRYVAGITASCWIEYGSRRLDIGNVANVDEDNQELVLLCTERQ